MMSKSIALENTYGAENYAPLPVAIERGEGVYVWDENGKRYLDMMSAYSAVSHGHCHPRLVKVLQNQAAKLGVVSRAYYSTVLGSFLKRACDLTDFEKALPMNTGAEAVETALKAARKWAYTRKGVAQGQAEIIACEGNFHGRTIAIVGLSTEDQYRNGFGPFPAGLKQVPFGDFEALEKAISPNTAAFLVEPIQGEGGIIVPPEGYLQKCADLCGKNQVLLICDEVQCGLGRTGKLMAYQHERIQPDGLILGKALGGGLLPVSLFLANNDLMSVFTPGDHGSTFGGYPLAASVAKEALDIIVEEKLSERSQEMGDYFMAGLRRIVSGLDTALVQDVRGKGLFIGLDMNPKVVGARDVCEKLMEKGLLSKDTHHTVVRFAPPLVISKSEIDWSLEQIETVLSSF
ncbi:MAG: ornithine--oxo-acid transaminase [Pseudomonadales bacterium]|nr:ornithine--oxo-acid transaminase [Pseudomonadales bacterium]